MSSRLRKPNAAGRQEVAVLLASRGMTLGLGVLTQSLLAYTLLPAGRGEYAICVLFGELASVAFMPAVGRGAQYFVMAGRMSVSQGASTAFAFYLLGSAATVLAAIPLIHSGLGFFRLADTSSFYLALLLIPASSLGFAATLQLEGLRRFAKLAVLSFFRSATGAVAVVALAWGLGLGVNGAILAPVLGRLAMFLLCTADLRRNCGFVPEPPSREGLRQTLGYGLKEYLAEASQYVDPRVGGLLLSVAAGRADIGLFTAGNELIIKVLHVPGVLSLYLLPRVAGDDAGKPELTAFCARITWWAVGVLLLVWFAVSTPLTLLLLSPAFAPVIPLTWIMSIGVLACSGAEIFAAYFRGINRPQVFSCAMWVGLSANAALFFAFYPLWGLHGAAWALTGGLLCRSFVLWFMFQKTARLPLRSTLLLRSADVARLWTAVVSLLRRKGTP